LGLRFYAGHNLHTPDGYNLGSLCVYDGPPRQFAPVERALLATLAGLVMRLLELRRTLGAHADRTAVLWDPVYRAIGGQLARRWRWPGTRPRPAARPASPKAWPPK